MQTKIIEIRDEGTYIPVLCVDMNPGPASGEEPYSVEWQYLKEQGYPCDGRPNILMTHLGAKGKATNDPYEWGDTTRATAHHYIIEHWPELEDGSVVDVQFITGQTSAPKIRQHLERQARHES